MNSKDIKLVADVLVLAQGKVLMVRYKDVSKYDGQKGWFLPDDYLGYGEHPGDAARRILREQVALDVDNIAFGYIESLGGEEGGAWHLIFHHKVELDKPQTLAPLGNVHAVEWFPLEELPARDAVAHDGWAIDVIGEVLEPMG